MSGFAVLSALLMGVAVVGVPFLGSLMVLGLIGAVLFFAIARASFGTWRPALFVRATQTYANNAEPAALESGGNGLGVGRVFFYAGVLTVAILTLRAGGQVTYRTSSFSSASASSQRRSWSPAGLSRSESRHSSSSVWGFFRSEDCSRPSVRWSQSIGGGCCAALVPDHLLVLAQLGRAQPSRPGAAGGYLLDRLGGARRRSGDPSSRGRRCHSEHRSRLWTKHRIYEPAERSRWHLRRRLRSGRHACDPLVPFDP